MAKKKAVKPLSMESLLRRYVAGTMMSPAQQRKQARRETTLAMNDSMRSLRTTYQRERERTLREQYAQGAWAGLLRGYGAEGSAESQSIKDAYAKAAGLQQAESEGFIAPTIAQQQANVGNAQAQAQTLSGFTGDVGTATPGVNAGVLNYLASLPKGTFAAQAESAAKGLSRAGAEAGGDFALREAQLGQSLREMQDEYTMAVKDLQAKRPGLFQEALGALKESGRGDLSTIINAMYLQNTMGKTEAELTGQYKGKLTPAERSRRAGVQAEKAATAAAAERVAISAMNAQSTRMNAKVNQQKARLEAAAQQAEVTGDRTKVESQFRQDAESWVRTMLFLDKKKGRPAKMPASKQALINGVFRTFARPLLQYGYSQEQLALWAAQIVNSFPNKWWDPKLYSGGTKSTTSGGGNAGKTQEQILAGQ
jgi:hypothetical protein